MSIDKLYIFEKPDAGKHFAKALGWKSAERTRNYIRQGNIAITWCLGHLIQQESPEHYRADIKKGWHIDKLPIIPKEWKMTFNKDDTGRKQQLFSIRDLMKQSQAVVIATDNDREGEVIGWEVVEFFNYTGKLYRMLYGELTPKVLLKANDNLEDAQKHKNRYFAGLGRMRADWLMGFNLTIGYTAANQSKLPPRNVINAGRVVSPLIFLLTERDNEIKAFVPEDHFGFKAIFNSKKGEYEGDYIIPDDIADDKLLKDKKIAGKIKDELEKETLATVISNETKIKKEAPPIGFSLSELQKLASKKLNLSPKETLDTAQELYEKHQLISYPRTDCQFVGEGQFDDRNSVISAIYKNIGDSTEQFKNVKSKINKNQKTKIWDDKKVGAHHAIIPTEEVKNLTNLSQVQIELYAIICKRYIAQFLPTHEYNSTTIMTQTKLFKHNFKTTGKVVLVEGWKLIEKENNSKDNELPNVVKDEDVSVKQISIQNKKTEPPKHYTYDSLLNDMNNIDKFIKNPKLKKIIKGKGIGTEATRADHIDGLFKKGLAKKEKKNIVATDKAHMVIKIMPDENKQPEVSAYWEEELDLIEKGESTLEKFLAKQEKVITRIIQKIKNGECELKDVVKGSGKAYKCDKCGSLTDNFTSKNKNKLWRCLNRECGALYADNRGKRGDIIEIVKQPDGDNPCPTCNKKMFRRKKKNEEKFFWVCSERECKTFCQDDNGKLGSKIESTKKTSEHKCPNCKDGSMIQRTGANGKFWGCNNYPKCKTTLQDDNDKPNYEAQNKPKGKQKSDHKCPNCDEGYLIKRKKKSDNMMFWGCNNFPNCKTIKNDNNGKPEE